MVSTLPPFSQLMEQKRRASAPFKRALRKADQAVFERLFDGATLHVQAGGLPLARVSMRAANQGKPSALASRSSSYVAL